MKGSWAGAMGQSQFMPSSFNNYAQDYDGDGRQDIWTTQADVFGVSRKLSEACGVAQRYYGGVPFSCRNLARQAGPMP